MKLCDTCIYRNNVEQLKPCIIYRDDCKLYERGDMTNDDAASVIKRGLDDNSIDCFDTKQYMAIDMAIKALEQEPCNTDTCKVVKAYMNEWDKPNNSDAISRQAVLDCLTATKLKKFDFILHAREEIKKLPSVNPQEPKTIQEKQAESEKYQKAFDDGYKNGYAQARFDYEQEPKTGHWILDETDNSITCDKCGCLIWANDISNGEAYYCPNCGCRMVEPQESEDEEV